MDSRHVRVPSVQTAQSVQAVHLSISRLRIRVPVLEDPPRRRRLTRRADPRRSEPDPDVDPR
jgi:hypothetical protein